MDSTRVINKILNRVEYLYILLAIIWPTIAALIEFDGAGRTVDFFLVVSLFKLLHDRNYRRVLLKVPVFIWGLWILYVFIQFGIMHHPEFNKDIYIYYFQIFTPFFIMTIAVRDIIKGGVNRITNILFCSFYFFAILSFLTIGAEITEDNRASIKGLNDFNDVAFACCFCIFILVVKYWLNRIKLKTMVIASLPALFVIMKMASRTALAILCIIVVAFFIEWSGKMLAKKKITITHIILVSGCMLILLLVAQKIGTQSFIASRVTETNDQVYIETGTILDKMGDRGPFYYFGFLAFLNDPIFGIGIKNFAPYGVYREIVCHTEYMVNMAETGIIGMVLFWSFIFSLFVCIVKTSKKFIPFPKIVLWLSLFIPMFIGLFFWTYDRIYVFVFYAFIVGYRTRSEIIKSEYKSIL